MRKTALQLLLICLSLWFTLQATAEDQWQGVQRIVAVGDAHGDFEHFVDVLRNAGLINRRRNWIADQTHFVQVGDLPDRGPDTDKIIELVQKLETQAESAGGMVHALLGNHEAMNVYGDLRYVHPGEYEALRSRQSRGLRNDFYDRYVAQLLANDPESTIDDALRDQFNAQVPLGFVEHRAAWSATSRPKPASAQTTPPATTACSAAAPRYASTAPAMPAVILAKRWDSCATSRQAPACA